MRRPPANSTSNGSRLCVRCGLLDKLDPRQRQFHSAEGLAHRRGRERIAMAGIRAILAESRQRQVMLTAELRPTQATLRLRCGDLRHLHTAATMTTTVGTGYSLMPSVNHLSKPTKRMDLPGGIHSIRSQWTPTPRCTRCSVTSWTGTKAITRGKMGKMSYQPILSFIAETREYAVGALRTSDCPTAGRSPHIWRELRRACPLL